MAGKFHNPGNRSGGGQISNNCKHDFQNLAHSQSPELIFDHPLCKLVLGTPVEPEIWSITELFQNYFQPDNMSIEIHDLQNLAHSSFSKQFLDQSGHFGIGAEYPGESRNTINQGIISDLFCSGNMGVKIYNFQYLIHTQSSKQFLDQISFLGPVLDTPVEFGI